MKNRDSESNPSKLFTYQQMLITHQYGTTETLLDILIPEDTLNRNGAVHEKTLSASKHQVLPPC